MILRLHRLLAAALTLAALCFAPVAAVAWGGTEASEKEVTEIEARLGAVEKTWARPEETAAERARRKFTEGETQFLLGDWLHASVLFYGALEEPEFRASPDYPRALGSLGDSLRRQGDCSAALGTYQELLRLENPATQSMALIGALDCRIKLHRLEGVDPLLAQAAALPPGAAPAELAYLVAKTTYFRKDLRPADRRTRGLADFEAVPPPYHLAAAYFQGTLQVEAGDLPAAAERFDLCLRLKGNSPSQNEIRELCALAAGRVQTERDLLAEAIDRYRAIPVDSPRYDEATYEVAWAQVRGKRFEAALETAALIVDLAPESQLAPEAAILTGHLDLRLGHYADAGEAFNRVINTYAPVRDEIDAILTMHENPARYFYELMGRQGKSFDVAAVLPPIAVKWASAQRDVAAASSLVTSLDETRRHLADSLALIDRIEAMLLRGGGLDAVPLAKQGWIAADAVENATLRLRGSLADLSAEAMAGKLPRESRAEFDAVRARRRALQPRVDRLPRDPAEVEARATRMKRRVDEVARAIYQVGYQADSIAAAIAGTEVYLNQHRGEIVGDDAGRKEFAADLRRQRTIVTMYGETLAALRLEMAVVKDAAGGTAQAAGDASLRAEYVALVARERDLLSGVRGQLSGGDARDEDRRDVVLGRCARADANAEQVKERFAATARRSAVAIGSWIAAERGELLRQQGTLAGIGDESKDVIGRIALRSFGAARQQFYRLVLKADVGVIDVAWSRKRERLEKIQQLSQQKAGELEALDRDFKLVLREVE